MQKARFDEVLQNNPTFGPRKLRSVLFEGNFGRAQQILDKNMFNTGTGEIDSRFHGSVGSEEDMKKLEASVSDLVYEQLSSSIDKTVKAIVPVVLDTQHRRCEKSMQHEVESQEKNLQISGLIDFIRDLNTQSLGRRDS
jgi:hypothetical protein